MSDDIFEKIVDTFTSWLLNILWLVFGLVIGYLIGHYLIT